LFVSVYLNNRIDKLKTHMIDKHVRFLFNASFDLPFTYYPEKTGE